MNFKRDILPHLVAVGIFFMVTVLLYSPIIFSGESLSQYDITQGLGAGKEIIDFRTETGEEALWTNSMFGGMPAYLINTQWSGDLIIYVHRLLSLWLPSAPGATFVSCLTFYILLLIFGVRPWLAIAGGLSFGLSTFFIISIEAGHMWKVWAIAYMPLVLGGVHLTFKGRYWLGFVLTALGLALELRSNHLQITYYLLLLLLVYGLVHLVYTLREGSWKDLLKPLGCLSLAAILALGCNFGKIWSVYEYGKFSTRGPSELTSNSSSGGGLDREYAFRWSYGIMEPLTLLIPEFFGGASVGQLSVNSNLAKALRDNGQPPVQVRQFIKNAQTYWGQQPGVAGPSYAGAIVILLFVMGLLLIDKQDRLWLGIAVILSIVLSWGHNFAAFNDLMFDFFPGYNKFRSVSMTLVIALLCIPLAGFMGLEKFLSTPRGPEVRKKLLMAGYITGGILLMALLYSFMGGFRGPVDDQIGSQVPPWYLEALRADRAGLLRGDAIRSLVFAGLAWLGLWYFYRQKVTTTWISIGLIVLIAIDLWGVNTRYLTSDDFIASETNKPAASAADQLILNDSDPNFRVLTYLQNPWNEAATSYFHKSLGGYHGAKMQRYAEVIEHCLDGEFRAILEDLQNQQTVSSQPVINLLNTRYFLIGNDQNGVIRNPHALGNAWFISTVIPVNSADEEIEKLCSLEPGTQAIIDQSKFDIQQLNFNGSGTITLQEYQPNRLKYESQNQDPGLAVFSEIYYPAGWQATIDGNPVEIIRANYILRALRIPPGNHEIEFVFKPAAYHVGNKIMMGSSVILILVVLGIFFREIKRTTVDSSRADHA